MCLIFFSLKNHPVYKLIVAANRDEFYSRETSAAQFWEDNPDVLGGRDNKAGGTWMAVTKAGRIGFVTNYRDPRKINPQALSRGQLVADYCRKTDRPEDYLKTVESGAFSYNGFNLIVGNPDELWYFSNHRAGIDKLQPGFYGLSNHLLETPWPKVTRGKEKLGQIFKSEKIQVERIFEALFDDQTTPDENLPDTGIGLERERALSSIFIRTPGYGSRSSTVVLVDSKNNLFFSERTYDLNTFEYTTRLFEFKVRQ